MKLFKLKTLAAATVLTILTACGGSADIIADSAPTQLAEVSCSDCAPVIDGLAEEFRSAALRRDKEPAADAAPAYPAVAADAVALPAQEQTDRFASTAADNI
jgi:hypothetical protein